MSLLFSLTCTWTTDPIAVCAMCHGLVYWCIYYLLWLSPIFATWGVIPVGFLSGFPLYLHLLFVLFFSYSLSDVIAWSPQMCFTCDRLLDLCVIVFPLVYLSLCLALCPCQLIPVRLLRSCFVLLCVLLFSAFVSQFFTCSTCVSIPRFQEFCFSLVY